MTYLSQRDPRWANITVGTGSLTIAQVGCTITVLAMLLGTTPDVVNERLKAVNGFLDGNKVIWAKVSEAFPGVTVRREWTYNNDDALANLPCLVQVDGAPIGGTIHFVEYIGNHQLIDPWDGQVKPTSTYVAQSYAVVKVPNVLPQSADSQIADQLQKQIEATNSCQIQLKTAIEQNASFQGQVALLQLQLNEVKSKYDESERTVIALKGQLEAVNKEDKDYAQKAYDAEHLAEDLGNNLHAIADKQNIPFDISKHDDITEEVLKELDSLGKLQKVELTPPPPSPLEVTIGKALAKEQKRSFLGLFFQWAQK